VATPHYSIARIGNMMLLL